MTKKKAQTIPALGPEWVYNKKTRGYDNSVTGQKMSRRQYDKTYGLLAKEGFKSFEEKAKTRKAQGVSKLRKFNGVNGQWFVTKQYKSMDDLLAYVKKIPSEARVVIYAAGTLNNIDAGRYRSDNDNNSRKIAHIAQTSNAYASDFIANYERRGDSYLRNLDKLKKVSKYYAGISTEAFE